MHYLEWKAPTDPNWQRQTSSGGAGGSPALGIAPAHYLSASNGGKNNTLALTLTPTGTGTYSVRFCAKDAITSGISYSAISTFTVVPEPLPQPPVATLILSGSSIEYGQGVTVTSTLADIDGDLQWHGVWVTAPGATPGHPNKGVAWTGGVATGSTSVISRTFVPSGTGTWQLHANGHDTNDAWGDSASATLVVLSDTTPPSTPANLSASNIGCEGFMLSWNPSVDNKGVAGYEVFISGSLRTTTSGTQMNIASLVANTTYSTAVRAFDSAGNYSQNGTLTVKTASAPSAPGGLGVSVLSSQHATITWNASANGTAQVTGYEIFLDGVSVGITNDTSFALTGLSPSTTYTATVRAVDASGNYSDYSQVFTFTTIPIPSDGLCLWLRADAGIELNSEESVCIWADQSGQGHHVYNIIDGTSSDLSISTANFGPVVQIQTGTNWLCTEDNPLYGATEGEVFIVLKDVSNNYVTKYPIGIGDYATFNYYYHKEDETLAISDLFGGFGAEVPVPEGMTDRNQWRLYNVSASPDEWIMRLNNTVIHSHSKPGSDYNFNAFTYADGNIVLGADTGLPPVEVAEIIIYRRSLGADEREAVVSYLNAKCRIWEGTEPPANLRIVGKSDASVTLAWSPSPTIGAAYELERKCGNEDYSLVGVVVSGATTHTDSGLAASTTYAYRLRAISDACSPSPYTSVVFTTTQPSATEYSAWALANGLDPNRPDDDVDGDGITSWQKFLHGSDLHSPESPVLGLVIFTPNN